MALIAFVSFAVMASAEQVSTCGDGTHYCEEVCCYNGADLAFCCDYKHPVCDVPNKLCHSSFEAVMKSKPVKPIVEEAKNERVGKCGDGTHYCEEVCCYNGADLAFCCDYQHPVCDVPNKLCHSSFEAVMKSTPVKPIVEEENIEKVGKCGDGTHYCEEVCCYNGADLAFCCDYQHPVCDVPNNLCHSSFEAAMQAATPKAVVEETNAMPLMKVDGKVGKCGDGTQHCEEVCCYNGADLAFCCDYQHPVCDVPNNLCHSSFEAVMQAAMPKAVVERTKAMPLMKVGDKVGKCGDGTQSCEEVCCYNGADLAFCCDFQHPVCDVPNHVCHLSFEAAMKVVKPIAEEKNEKVGKCGDGTHYCDEVCCYNGADLAFCCDFKHPVCDVPNELCHSSFEAAMKGDKPGTPQIVV